MNHIDLSRQLVWDTLSASCIYGPRALIPALAGSYVGHVLHQYCKSLISDSHLASRVHALASPIIKALCVVGVCFLASSTASLLGLSVSILEVACIHVVSKALFSIVSSLHQPQNVESLPGSFHKLKTV